MAETGGLWIINGESGASPHWEWNEITESGTATITQSATAVNNGSNGYLFTSNGTDTAYATKTFSAIDEIFVRFYIFIPTGFNVGVGSENVYLASFNGRGSDCVSLFGFNTSLGTPVKWIYKTNYAYQESTTNFSLNAWHYITLSYLKAVDVGGGQGWVDGDLVFTDLNQTIADQATVFYLGPWEITAAIGASDALYFDDIKADTAYVGAYSDAPTGTSIPVIMNHYRRLRS